MTDVIFTILFFSILLIGVIAMHAFYVIETNKEKSKLVNALIARKPEEFRDLNLADKVQPIKPLENKPSDLISIDNMSEEDFDTHIKQQLENE